MTTEYDRLMSIHRKAEENADLRQIAEWLFDICIEQANEAKEGWNFEVWLKSWGELYRDPFERKAKFLDSCHDALAHKGIEAFDLDTQKLIEVIYYGLVVGRDVYDIHKLKKRFPKVVEFLEKLGYKPMDKKGWMWTK